MTPTSTRPTIHLTFVEIVQSGYCHCHRCSRKMFKPHRFQILASNIGDSGLQLLIGAVLCSAVLTI